MTYRQNEHREVAIHSSYVEKVKKGKGGKLFIKLFIRSQTLSQSVGEVLIPLKVGARTA